MLAPQKHLFARAPPYIHAREQPDAKRNTRWGARRRGVRPWQGGREQLTRQVCVAQAGQLVRGLEGVE